MNEGFKSEEKPQHDDENEESGRGMTRREFLTKSIVGAAGLATSAGVLTLLNKKPENPQHQGEEDTEPDDTLPDMEEPIQSETDLEELDRNSEKYERETMRHRLRISLAYDEVLFFDANNEPVGEPVKFENFIIDRNGSPYLLAPGPVNEAGLLTQGIAREWSRYVRDKLQQQYPDRQIAGMEHVTNDFIRAYNLTREPDLKRLIDEGEIRQYIDIIKYFANKRPVDEEGRSRIEYVADKIEIPNVPKVVEDELVKVIPGLCAQESKFDPYVTSNANAQGVFQFIPGTWVNEYNRPIETITNIREQTAVAGQFFSDIYRQVTHFAGSDNLNKIKNRFSGEESYLRQFFVPLMLNAYNAGSRRIGEGVADYLKHYNPDDIQAGRDVFIAVADHMYKSNEGTLNRYGEHARGYVPQVYAQAIEIALSSENT